MSSKKSNHDSPFRRPWVHPHDQGGLLALAAAALVFSVSYWCYLGGHRGELIEIDRASPLQAQFVVDINQAEWPEIIQLPGLGEVLAQRLVTDRETNGPFKAVDDLVRVNGIGVKTLEKIRPYLLPIPKDTDWAATENDNTLPVQ